MGFENCATRTPLNGFFNNKFSPNLFFLYFVPFIRFVSNSISYFFIEWMIPTDLSLTRIAHGKILTFFQGYISPDIMMICKVCISITYRTDSQANITVNTNAADITSIIGTCPSISKDTPFPFTRLYVSTHIPAIPVHAAKKILNGNAINQCPDTGLYTKNSMIHMMYMKSAPSI
jgi:hypothetical protein